MLAHFEKSLNFQEKIEILQKCQEKMLSFPKKCRKKSLSGTFKTVQVLDRAAHRAAAAVVAERGLLDGSRHGSARDRKGGCRERAGLQTPVPVQR